MAEIPFLEEIEKPQEEPTPTLAQVFKEAMETLSTDMKVSIPAEVIRYDHTKQLVDVRGIFKRKYPDGVVEEPPIIYNVPVAFPRAGGAFMTMPMEVGHRVMLVFSDRSLEKFLSNGEKHDPEDARKHHVSDAMALPGLYPFSEAASVNNPDDVIIKNAPSEGDGYLEIRVKKNGHIQILNSHGEELLKVMTDILTVIRQSVVYTCSGPQQLRHFYFSTVHARLRTFLQK